MKQVSKTSKTGNKLQTPDIRSKKTLTEDDPSRTLFYLKSTSKNGKKGLKDKIETKSNGKFIENKKGTKERISYTSTKTDQPNFFVKNDPKKVIKGKINFFSKKSGFMKSKPKSHIKNSKSIFSNYRKSSRREESEEFSNKDRLTRFDSTEAAKLSEIYWYYN